MDSTNYEEQARAELIALFENVGKELVRPGAGWATRAEICDILGCGRDKFYRSVRRLMQAGKLERKRIGSVIYYRKTD